MKRTCAGLLIFLLSVSSALAQEPCRPHSSTDKAEWDRVFTRLESLRLARPESLPHVLPGQDLLLSDVTTGRTAGDRVKQSLVDMTAAIRRTATAMGATATRPVHLLLTDMAGPGPTMAFTDCRTDAEPILTGASGEVWLPGNACEITVFMSAHMDHEEVEFSLAHEWMHVLQYAAYGNNACGASWWVEGSAEWFAHEVRPNFTGRAGAIDQFLSRVTTRSLNDMTYEAQVFLFWGARRFGAPWAFELGRGDDRLLASVEGTAQVIGPDHWQAFAEAVADGAITYPDGRAIAAIAPLPLTVDGGSTTIEGPSLSVQFRTVQITTQGDTTVTFEPNGGLLGMRSASGEWDRLEGRASRTVSTTCNEPRPIQVVAIGTTGSRLDARFDTDVSGATPCRTGCPVGAWIETTAERRGQRISDTVFVHPPLDGTVQQVTYKYPGPLYTFNADGTFTIDDPRVYTHHAGGVTGRVMLTTALSTAQTIGEWQIDDRGLLVMRETRFVEVGSMTVMELGGPSPISTDRVRRGSPIAYRFSCVGNELRTNVALAPAGTPPRRFVESAPTAVDR